MNLHEYQAKQLFAEYGLPVSEGFACDTPQEAAEAADKIGGDMWVVKTQVHAGGRGKGGGVKVATSMDKVREYADEKLRMKGAVLGKFEQGSYANAYDNTYYFDISVAGGRLYKDGTGPCIGSVNIFLHTMANINNNFHQAIMAGHKSRGVFQNNLNLYVITELQEILDKIK